MASLLIRHLSKSFGDSDTGVHALDDVNLAVEDGELLVLLGPSGSGKTTLLRAIAGLARPSGGQILLNGSAVYDDAAVIELPPNRRGLGMVFQNFALWPHMTVRENVAYPLKIQRMKREACDARVAEVLDLVHCRPLAGRLPSTLSGGQQQRIALARALAGRPSLILFDEPLSNLDALLRVELREQLRLIHRQTRFTGVYVTHDQAEALTLGDRICIMRAGRIEQIGTPDDVYRRPATAFVAAFLGMTNCVNVRGDGGAWTSDVGCVVDRGMLPAGPEEGLTIRFRPDSLVICRRGATPIPPTAGATLTIEQLTVVDRIFNGEQIDYLLKAGDRLLKGRAVSAADRFDVGDEVEARIDGTRTAIFATPAPNGPAAGMC